MIYVLIFIEIVWAAFVCDSLHLFFFRSRITDCRDKAFSIMHAQQTQIRRMSEEKHDEKLKIVFCIRSFGLSDKFCFALLDIVNRGMKEFLHTHSHMLTHTHAYRLLFYIDLYLQTH